MKVVHWFVDGCHRSADDPHKSNSNASCAREAVGAICENWWPSYGDYPLNFDVVITAPPSPSCAERKRSDGRLYTVSRMCV